MKRRCMMCGHDATAEDPCACDPFEEGYFVRMDSIKNLYEQIKEEKRRRRFRMPLFLGLGVATGFVWDIALGFSVATVIRIAIIVACGLTSLYLHRRYNR